MTHEHDTLESILTCTATDCVELLTVPRSNANPDGDPIAYKCGWLDWIDSEGIDTDELEDDYMFDSDRA